jgi:glycosyltransferase involved in cell wall biosynthesis
LRAFIVGDRQNDYSAQLHREAEALPSTSGASLKFVPENNNPYIYLRAADIVVCSSRLECYPRVILEAMAFGLPLITTPAFGISEQVKEDCNALIYQPDDVGQLAAHLARLCTDKALRLRLGLASRKLIKSLPTMEDTIDAFARLIREASFCEGYPKVLEEAQAASSGRPSLCHSHNAAVALI